MWVPIWVTFGRVGWGLDCAISSPAAEVNGQSDAADSVSFVFIDATGILHVHCTVCGLVM